MIVYYKNFSNMLMLLGAALGAGSGYLYLGGNILGGKNKVSVFIFALFIFAGIVLSRLLAAFLASSKIRRLQERLYRETDPAGFLWEFEPMNARIPKNLAEYVHGQVQISFAKEALGDFDAALAAVRELKPETLRLHALSAAALVVNQKANLYLLRGEIENVEAQLSDMKILAETAAKRAKMLEGNLRACIRLQELRMNAIKAEPETDIGYLEEEIRLSTNLIHKKEMQLELSEYLLRIGERDRAEAILREILADRKGLYTETRAEELLSDPASIRRYKELIRDEESGKIIGSRDSDGFVVIRE